MDKLDAIGEQIRKHLEEKNAARDGALKHSRTLIRHCSMAIRAVHRNDRKVAEEHIQSANELVKTLSKKYMNKIANPPLGKKFQECFDIRRGKPSDEYVKVYGKVKKELGNSGVEFQH